MSENTGISWTHHTFNPWSGCAKISAGCAHCYAAALPPKMRRMAEWGENGTRIPASESYWNEPLKWARKAAAAGERRRVFCASVADVFEDRADLDPWRERLWDLIRQTPELDWLLLTKRPERMARWAADHEWPANAWAGTSVEDQRAAEKRIPYLLKVPAAVRFLSCEPLLGLVEGLDKYLSKASLGQCPCLLCKATGLKNREPGRLGSGQPGDGPCPDCHEGYVGGIGWVIVGGESGPHARPMHPEWARGLRDQCEAAEVPFHFKQWGEWAPWLNEAHLTHNGAEKHAHQWLQPDGNGGYCWIVDGDGSWSNWTGEPPQTDTEHKATRTAIMGKHGKHGAGRILDGRTWDEFPVME